MLRDKQTNLKTSRDERRKLQFIASIKGCSLNEAVLSISDEWILRNNLLTELENYLSARQRDDVANRARRQFPVLEDHDLPDSRGSARFNEDRR